MEIIAPVLIVQFYKTTQGIAVCRDKYIFLYLPSHLESFESLMTHTSTSSDQLCVYECCVKKKKYEVLVISFFGCVCQPGWRNLADSISPKQIIDLTANWLASPRTWWRLNLFLSMISLLIAGHGQVTMT